MLEKSLTSPSDVIIYDLEDSVPPELQHKDKARGRLAEFLHVGHLRRGTRVASPLTLLRAS